MRAVAPGPRTLRHAKWAVCAVPARPCSPLAWLRQAAGGLAPFDRHDWVVDRCGKEVRYVIDFYFHDDKAGTNEVRARCGGGSSVWRQ